MSSPVQSTATADDASGNDGDVSMTSNNSPPKIAPIASPKHHRHPERYIESFSAIDQMRKNTQLCDVILEVNGETINAHKLVLASASPYFHAMFTIDMLERDQRNVTINDIDVTTLRQIIDFIYTGELMITADNVQVLLASSCLVQIQYIRDVCCEFLRDQLHPSNCIGTLKFADIHSCKELQIQSNKFFLQNFEEVAETEEFLLLPFEEVKDVISNNQLNSSEDKVFLAVLSWVKHNLDERQKYIAELMPHVRLALIRNDSLMNLVESETLVQQNPQCKDLVIEALKFQFMPEQRTLLANQRTIERRPDGMETYVFSVGGEYESIAHSGCNVLNLRKRTWCPIAPMLSARSKCGVTSARNLVYAVGGYDGKTSLATAECYNFLTNSWTYISSMGTKRSRPGICALNGVIYVCGGSNGISDLHTMERYDPLTDVWYSCPAMNSQREYCYLAVLDNCVYVLGGYDSDDFKLEVERFDPREGRWTLVSNMTAIRYGCGVAGYDGCLYCIGGINGDSRILSSGERLNLRRNAWEAMAPMDSERSEYEVVEIDGYLYALGGNDGSALIEKYDIQKNQWTAVCSMETNHKFVGATVQDCLYLEPDVV